MYHDTSHNDFDHANPSTGTASGLSHFDDAWRDDANLDSQHQTGLDTYFSGNGFDCGMEDPFGSAHLNSMAHNGDIVADTKSAPSAHTVTSGLNFNNGNTAGSTANCSQCPTPTATFLT